MKPLQLSKPHAILVVGIPGSGKTFFAQHFSETFNAPFIDASHLYNHLQDHEAVAAVLRTFLSEIAKTHQTFIHEPVASSRTSRTEFAKWARSVGYEPLVVWVQTDGTTAERRSQKQGRSINEHEDLVRRFSAPHASEKPAVISGKHTQSSQARAILTRLSAAHVPEALSVPKRVDPHSRTIDIKRG